MEPKSSLQEVELEHLPEGCIATILSFTTPLDACSSAVVSKTFQSAADSDALWDKLLPHDLQSIISRCSAPPALPVSSKKDLFFSLCDNPILIDDSMKSFSLDKRNGKKCYMLAARDLVIIWGDTPMYWDWINLPDSRFLEVAELKLVLWLEIRGQIDTSMLSTATTYAAYLVFKVLEDAYGLDDYPTEVSIGITAGEKVATNVWLIPDDEVEEELRSRRGFKGPTRRGDKWLEIEVGEYINHHGEDGELEISIKEVEGGAPKSGLIVQGIEIRPKI